MAEPDPSAAPGTVPARTASSLDRIRRLERLELERLELEEHREAARADRIAGVRPSGGRHDTVDRIETLTRIPLTVLGAAWLVLVVLRSADAHGRASSGLLVAIVAVWGVLLVEYVVRLVVSPDASGYLRRRWVEPATVLVPPFQGWHLVGMERTAVLTEEAWIRFRSLLRHHNLLRVLVTVAELLLVGSWIVLLFEEHARGSNIHDYPDALWWAVVTVTTVGYGDRFPVTEGGRVVAVVLMLAGISLLGVLTATIASAFMKEHTDANKDALQRSHASLGQQLAVISDRLADVERRLGATPDEVAAVDARADAEAADDGTGPEGPST